MNLDVLRGLVQPDQRSCGPSALVAAHMLLDPGYRPDFPRKVLALHRELASSSYAGHPQLPWPRALGTAPWAAALAMESFAGIRYHTRVLRLGSRAAAVDAVVAAVARGHPCPLYVGSAWLPRHVVLAAARSPEGVQVYDPARGTVDVLTRSSLLAGELTVFGRWDRSWFAVLPSPSRERGAVQA